MQRRDFVLVVPMLVATGALARDEAKLDGVFELVLSPKDQITKGKKYVIFRQDGGHLRVKDIETGELYLGNVRGKEFAFPMVAYSENPPMYFEQAKYVGAWNELGIAGTVRTKGGEEFQWVASRLTSVWQCSNHHPYHVARSREEIVKFTKERHCEGWRRPRFG